LDGLEPEALSVRAEFDEAGVEEERIEGGVECVVVAVVVVAEEGGVNAGGEVAAVEGDVEAIGRGEFVLEIG